MPDRVTDEDLELLGELGVDAEPASACGRTASEQRIIAGFEEIEKFIEEHGRASEHGENRDIFERLYAMRLDRLRDSAECRQILRDFDSQGLLDIENDNATDVSADNELNDNELLASLGVEAKPKADITQLIHVRPRDEIKAAEEIAQRNPCKDFDRFRLVFETVQRELESGDRQTRKYKDYVVLVGLALSGGFTNILHRVTPCKSR